MSQHLRHGSLGMIFETGLSTLNISLAKRVPNTINFVDMRLVLVFLATFLQSLFNLFNVQNLIGLYALCNIRQRQMLALAALNRRRRMQRRRNRRFRFWCLPRPRQSWFEIHYNDHRIPDGFFKQQLRVRRATFNQLLNNVSPHVAKALSKDGCKVEGCESWENICKLKGENKPSPYWE